MIQELQKNPIIYHCQFDSDTANQNVSKGSPVNFLWGRAQCIPEAGLTLTVRVYQAYSQEKSVAIFWNFPG